MKLRTYRAWTMAEALATVKQDLGADAVILHTRTFERGGFLGFGRKSVCEITAARAADFQRENVELSGAPTRRAEPASAAPLTAQRSGSESIRASAAMRAYRSESDASSRPAAPSRTAASVADAPFDLEVEREKTKRLAQALSVQLEKQGFGQPTASTSASASASASANERATQQAAASALVPTHPLPGSEPVAQRFILMPKPASKPAAAQASGGGASTGQSAAVSRTASSAAGTGVAPIVPQSSSATPAARSIAAPVSASGFVPAPHAVGDSGGAPGLARFAVPVGEPRGGASHAAEAHAAEAHAATERARVSFAPSAQPADELSVISRFVDRVLSGDMTPVAPASAGSVERAVERAVEALPSRGPSAVTLAPVPSAQPDPFSGCIESMYARLIEQEVAEDLASRIMRDVRAELSAAVDAGAIPSERVVREAVERRIAALLPAESADGSIAFGGRIVAGRSGARRIAFVGPTGVGKTTTLAKLAAQLKLKHGLSVGIVAADTYRIAAVDQLRTYAEILEVPVEIAASPADAAEACDALQTEHSVDVILIDTAGRSQNDRMKLSELRAFLKAAQPDETHLVLSATAGARTLAREAEAFGALGVDKLILTKLDEAATFGTLISLVERLGKRVSFFTHGQEVPEHIEIGRSRRLAELVMGHEVR